MSAVQEMLWCLQHDPQMQRFLSMRATSWHQFKPTPSNFLLSFAMFALPVALMSIFLHKSVVRSQSMTETKLSPQYKGSDSILTLSRKCCQFCWQWDAGVCHFFYYVFQSCAFMPKKINTLLNFFLSTDCAIDCHCLQVKFHIHFSQWSRFLLSNPGYWQPASVIFFQELGPRCCGNYNWQFVNYWTTSSCLSSHLARS